MIAITPKDDPFSRTFHFTLSYLKQNKAAMFSVIILLILTICSIFADYIAPYSYTEQNLSIRLQAPNSQHLLGTDQLGRDILSRLIYGSRIVIYVMALSFFLSATIGITLGLVSGYWGGLVDQVIMRVIDILLAFPGIILALAFIALLGGNLFNAVFAFSFRLIGPYARLVRGQVLTAKEHVWVESAKVIGASPLRIVRRHILPNISGPIIIQATFNFGRAILGVASLSFLGLGAKPPTPGWGIMIYEALAYMRSQPHSVVFPGLAIFLVVLSINILGDSIRDAMEGRQA